eukprot:COSAG05_NODE_24858_length_199_cov_2731.020000_1_plen_26_part_10
MCTAQVYANTGQNIRGKTLYIVSPGC